MVEQAFIDSGDGAVLRETETAGAFPSISRATYALVLFIFAYFFYFADIQVITLLVAPIKQAYGINDTAFSLLAAGPPMIAIFAMGLPMAALVDRWNRRNLLAAAIATWTVTNVLCAFAPNFWVLFALKVGVAMGGAWFYPTVVSLLSDMFAPRHRTMAFTLLQLCGTSGVGLAVLLSGGAIALSHHLAEIALPFVGHIAWWQWSFILVSAPAPLGAILLFTIEEPARHKTAQDNGAADAKFLPYLRKHWGALAAVALGTSAANILIYASRSWLPEYFIRMFSENPAEAGALSGLVLTVGSGFGIGAGGVIAYWLKRRGYENANLAVVISSYVIPAALIAVLPLLGTPFAAVIVFGAAFLLFNLHGGPQIDIIQGVVPNAFRGRYVTLVLMIGYAGAFLGPVAVGYLNDHVFGTGTGIRYSMMIALLLSCVSAAALWGARAKSVAALLRSHTIQPNPLNH
ncbi:MAG TPA: MFS transporter [Rhizomicrobium sp.]|jgi:MFS family permease